MEEVREFDTVRLKDGKVACVVEAYDEQDVFDVDIGSSSADWDTITVKREDIVEIIRRG